MIYNLSHSQGPTWTSTGASRWACSCVARRCSSRRVCRRARIAATCRGPCAKFRPSWPAPLCMPARAQPRLPLRLLQRCSETIEPATTHRCCINKVGCMTTCWAETMLFWLLATQQQQVRGNCKDAKAEWWVRNIVATEVGGGRPDKRGDRKPPCCRPLNRWNCCPACRATSVEAFLQVRR